MFYLVIFIDFSEYILTLDLMVATRFITNWDRYNKGFWKL